MDLAFSMTSFAEESVQMPHWLKYGINEGSCVVSLSKTRVRQTNIDLLCDSNSQSSRYWSKDEPGVVAINNTPFQEMALQVSDEERLKVLVDGISKDATLPFRDQIKQDLLWLSEPDPMDEDDCPSPEATSMFLRFMKEPLGWDVPPQLTVGVNGALLAGWERSKGWHMFLYFMRNGTVQYVARRPNKTLDGPATLARDGVRFHIFESPEELNDVKEAFYFVFPESRL